MSPEETPIIKESDDYKKPEYLDARSTERTIRHMLVALVVIGILATLGASFGIYATIQINNILSPYSRTAVSESLLKDADSESDVTTTESSYGVPTNKDSIEYISIVYNNGKDFVDIINDANEENGLEYYTFDDNDEYIGDVENINVDEYLQYFMDNDVQYLGDDEYTGDEYWGVEVTSDEGVAFVGGTSDAPEWFNNLLKKLNVDQKGYKYKNS